MAAFTVNGKSYEFVSIDDFTLDELCLLWDYGKLTIDQVGDVEGFHPGLIKTLIHVSVARAEPGETAKQIGQVTGSLKVPELLAMWEQISEEVETIPPPSEPNKSGQTGSSGEDSLPTGEPAQEPSPANGSGSPGSDTGPVSDPKTLAL